MYVLQNIIAVNPHVNGILDYPTFRSSTMGVGYLSFETLMHLITPSFSSGSNHEIARDYVEEQVLTHHFFKLFQLEMLMKWCQNWLV